MGWSPAARRGIRRFFPTLVWHVPCLERTVAGLRPGARIIDLGAGGRRATPATVCVDFVAIPGTDVVADIHRLPFKDASVDCVACTGTLEHVTDPPQAAREIARVLRPGGIVHVEIPFLQPYHADPVDFQRWTLPGLCRFVEGHGFHRLDAGVHMGPASALAVILPEFFSLFVPTDFLRKAVSAGMEIGLFWLKYLDYFLVRRQRAHVLASGCYFVGVKDEGVGVSAPPAWRGSVP